MYLLASRLKRLGMLGSGTVVATVMSNGGFIKSIESLGAKVERTQVGDRFVYERMQENGANLGGEQSGHIIIRKYATTGDGILTAIMLSEEIADTGSTLADLTKDVLTFPQLSVSVRVKDKRVAIEDSELIALAERKRSELGDGSRLIIRESGTEPKIRIMVESESESLCRKCTDEILTLLRNRGHTDE